MMPVLFQRKRSTAKKQSNFEIFLIINIQEGDSRVDNGLYHTKEIRDAR